MGVYCDRMCPSGDYNKSLMRVPPMYVSSDHYTRSRVYVLGDYHKSWVRVVSKHICQVIKITPVGGGGGGGVCKG